MDKGAFTQMVLEMEPMLYRVARTILHNDADCADAVQEAILRAWRFSGTLRDPNLRKTWMVRIVLNECNRLLRRQKPTVPLDELPLSTPAIDTSIFDALQALEPRYRMPLMLHYVEGFSVAEIASMLRLPQGTVKSRLYRGRAVVKADLTQGELI